MNDLSPFGTNVRFGPARIAPLLLGAALCSGAILAGERPGIAGERTVETTRFAFTGTYRYRPASKGTRLSRNERPGATASIGRTPRDRHTSSPPPSSTLSSPPIATLRQRLLDARRKDNAGGARRATAPTPIVIRASTGRTGRGDVQVPSQVRQAGQRVAAQPRQALSRATRSNLGLAPNDPQHETGAPLPITRAPGPTDSNASADDAAAVAVALSRAVDSDNRTSPSVTSGSGPETSALPPLPARHLRTDRPKRALRRSVRRAARPPRHPRTAVPAKPPTPKSSSTFTTHPDWAANALFRPD